MQDPFDQKKSYILQEIASSVLDASPKGTIDEPCWPIIQTINSHPDMVTTSSCSGRVSVFLEGVKQSDAVNRSIGAKGHEGRWLFVSHDPKELSGWYNRMNFEYVSSGFQIGASTRYILFKFEPLILHVKCRNTIMANRVYQAAMACGFRESGIGTNDIVGIRISIKLDIRKLQQLGRSMESLGVLSAEASSHIETKEERRERKRKEGLERQRLKRENDDKNSTLQVWSKLTK